MGLPYVWQDQQDQRTADAGDQTSGRSRTGHFVKIDLYLPTLGDLGGEKKKIKYKSWRKK